MNEITELNNEEIFHMCGQRDSTLSGVSSSQIDLWIKCYLSQNPGKFFCVCQKKKRERERERDSKVYMEWKKKSSLANTILKNNFVGLML